MKYIVIGLGIFGANIARELKVLGHEVFGVDKDMELVELVKDELSGAICVDCEKEHSARSLPLDQADWVIIAIGEHTGSNILVAALMKKISKEGKHKNKVKVACRITNPLQEEVLKQLGVDIVIHPEQESAFRWATKFSYKSLKEYMKISPTFSIMRIATPEQFINKKIRELNIKTEYNIHILNVEKTIEKKGKKIKKEVIGLADTVIEEDDILTLYGEETKLTELLKTFED